MSASTDKKLRKEAREAGTDKKSQKAAEEAKKQKKTKRNYTIAIIAAIVFIVAVIFLNTSFLYNNTTAVKIGDTEYSPAKVNYMYGYQYTNFVQQYGQYASLFGLDTTYGLSGLGSQECGMAEDGGTWRDYFLNQAVNNLTQVQALCAYAEENGISLSEEDIESINTSYASLDEIARSYGYGNGNKFLAANYGKGVTADLAMEMEQMIQTANLVYQQKYSEVYDKVSAEFPEETAAVADTENTDEADATVDEEAMQTSPVTEAVNEEMSEWITSLTEGIPVEKGFFFRLAGKNG